MKFQLIYTLFALVSMAIIFSGNSTGAGAVQGQDRTGSPLSAATCQLCHNAGAFSPTIQAELLENGTPVSNFVAGQTYTLRVTVMETTGSPVRYGFQAVALTGDSDEQAGTFGTPPAGVKVTPLNGRNYAEQSAPNTANGIFEIEWTAPEAGAGEVRIYASGVAANGANGSGGDGGVFLVDPVVLTEMVSSTNVALAGNASFELLRNPVVGQIDLRLQTELAGGYEIRLFDPMGRSVSNQYVQLIPGTTQLSINAADLPNGLYFLTLTDGKQVFTERVIKR